MHHLKKMTDIVPDKENDLYPWFDKEDPRKNMTDQEILEKYVDLSDSDLNEADKLIQTITEIQGSFFS